MQANLASGAKNDKLGSVMHDDPPQNFEGSSESAAAPQSVPRIPHHTLVRLIEQGGRGDVWLACDAEGIFRAVKIFYRDHFESDDAYAWELHDLKNFESISAAQE